jgi:hypothetical protein
MGIVRIGDGRDLRGGRMVNAKLLKGTTSFGAAGPGRRLSAAEVQAVA